MASATLISASQFSARPVLLQATTKLLSSCWEALECTSRASLKVNTLASLTLQNLEINENDVLKAQLGLAHSFSRSKCAQDVNRQDKPIIQTIALIEQMDKDINTFCMRLKEWFAWHFPEMTKIVNDNHIYAKLVNLLAGKRENINDELKDELTTITMDEEKSQQIIDAAKISMGMDMSETD